MDDLTTGEQQMTQQDQQEAMPPLVFLDVETDGLYAGRQPWEIAMIRRDPGADHDEERRFFVHIDLTDAEPKGLEVGGYYRRHPYGLYLAGLKHWAPEYTSLMRAGREAAITVARMTHGAHLVGAVPGFDAETLAGLLRRHGLTPGWHHRVRCVESLTAGHLRRHVGGLRDCAEALGIEVDPEGVHTALGDATLVRRIWDAVMGDA